MSRWVHGRLAAGGFPPAKSGSAQGFVRPSE